MEEQELERQVDMLLGRTNDPILSRKRGMTDQEIIDRSEPRFEDSEPITVKSLPTNVWEYADDNAGFIPQRDAGNYEQQLERYRAQKQSGVNQIGTAVANLPFNIAFGLVRDVGYMGALMTEWGDERDYSNALTQWAEKMRNPFGSPHRENPNKVFDLYDPAWWVDNGQQLVESVGTFALEGVGVGSLFAKTGSALAKTLQAEQMLMKYGAKPLTSLTLGYIEGAQIGADTYKNVYKERYNEHFSILLNRGASQEQADNIAKNLAKADAARGAALATQINTIGVGALNMTTIAPLFKDKNMLAYMDKIGAKPLAGESSVEYLSRLRQLQPNIEHSPLWKTLLREGLQEGIVEEGGVNTIAQYAGEQRGGINKGVGLGETLFSKENALQAIMGALGGVGQAGGIQLLGKKMYTDPTTGKQRKVTPHELDYLYRKDAAKQYVSNLVSDLDESLKLNDKLSKATSNYNAATDSKEKSKYSDEIQQIQEDLFNIAKFRSITNGTGDLLINTFNEIKNSDNTTPLHLAIDRQIADLQNELNTTTNENRKTEINTELDRLGIERSKVVNQTDAMIKGLSQRIGDDAYKTKADEAIRDIEQLTKDFDKFHQKYNFDEDKELYGLDKLLFAEHLKMYDWNKRIVKAKNELAETEATLLQHPELQQVFNDSLLESKKRISDAENKYKEAAEKFEQLRNPETRKEAIKSRKAMVDTMLTDYEVSQKKLLEMELNKITSNNRFTEEELKKVEELRNDKRFKDDAFLKEMFDNKAKQIQDAIDKGNKIRQDNEAKNEAARKAKEEKEAKERDEFNAQLEAKAKQNTTTTSTTPDVSPRNEKKGEVTTVNEKKDDDKFKELRDKIGDDGIEFLEKLSTDKSPDVKAIFSALGSRYLNRNNTQKPEDKITGLEPFIEQDENGVYKVNVAKFLSTFGFDASNEDPNKTSWLNRLELIAQAKNLGKKVGITAHDIIGDLLYEYNRIKQNKEKAKVEKKEADTKIGVENTTNDEIKDEKTQVQQLELAEMSEQAAQLAAENIVNIYLHNLVKVYQNKNENLSESDSELLRKFLGLKVGTKITIRIAKQHSTYEVLKDDKDEVPIEILADGENIGYLNEHPQTHGGFVYTVDKTTNKRKFISDGLISFFENGKNAEVYNKLRDWYFNEKPKEDAFKLLNTDLMKPFVAYVQQYYSGGKLILGNSGKELKALTEALTHINNILFFSKTGDAIFDEMNVKALMDWGIKVERDALVVSQVRDNILQQEFTGEISYISSGSPNFNIKDGKHIYSFLGDISENPEVIHIWHTSTNGSNKVIYDSEGNEELEKEVGEFSNTHNYILVDGFGGKQIPVQIQQTTVQDSRITNNEVQKAIEDRLVSLIKSIIPNTLFEVKGAKLADKTGILEEIEDYVVVGSLGGNFKFKINVQDGNDTNTKSVEVYSYTHGSTPVYYKIQYKLNTKEDGSQYTHITIQSDKQTELVASTAQHNVDVELRKIIQGLRRNVKLENGKLKSVVKLHSSLQKFFDNKTEVSTKEFLLKSNAIITDLKAIRDNNGKPITVVSAVKSPKTIINIKVDNKVEQKPTTSAILLPNSETDTATLQGKGRTEPIQTQSTPNESNVEVKTETIPQYSLDTFAKTNAATIVDEFNKLSDNPIKYREENEGVLTAVTDKLLESLGILDKIPPTAGAFFFQDTIYITSKFFEFSAQKRALTLLHENIHGFILSPKFTGNGAYKQLLSDVKALLETVKEDSELGKYLNGKVGKTKQTRLEYYKQHPEEFIAHGFSTDKTLAIALSKTKFDGTIAEKKEDSVWNKIVEIVLKVAKESGIDVSYLDKLQEILDDYVYGNEISNNVETIPTVIPVNETTNDEFDNLADDVNLSDENVLSEIPVLNPDSVKYQLKSVNILLSDKTKQIFDKGKKANWSIDKILQELQIPKEQKQLVIDSYNEGNKTPEQLAIDIASKYSYSVEIETALTKTNKEEGKAFADPETGEVYYEGEYKQNIPTAYYSNLTVPGGTNYTENRIITPQIVPSIKGHAQFAEKEDIGWFRSDEKDEKGTYTLEDYTQDDLDNAIATQNEELYQDINRKEKKKVYKSEQTKTRRILELQSDLFQKGRDKDSLIANLFAPEGYDKSTSKEQLKELGETLELDLEGQNQFLQLLNKDNNWVTFFIKSIIQDSAKRGYEKVLFPKGETAAKIEGHETIAERLYEIDRAIEQAKEGFDESQMEEYEGYPVPKSLSKEEANIKIKQLEKEKQELKSQGIEKLKPIEAFYEIKVGNILEKQFGKDNVKTITDEYGNQWREIEINKVNTSTILLSDEAILSEIETNEQGEVLAPNGNVSKLYKDIEKLIEEQNNNSLKLKTLDINNIIVDNVGSKYFDKSTNTKRKVYTDIYRQEIEGNKYEFTVKRIYDTIHDDKNNIIKSSIHGRLDFTANGSEYITNIGLKNINKTNNLIEDLYRYMYHIEPNIENIVVEASINIFNNSDNKKLIQEIKKELQVIDKIIEPITLHLPDNNSENIDELQFKNEEVEIIYFNGNKDKLSLNQFVNILNERVDKTTDEEVELIADIISELKGGKKQRQRLLLYERQLKEIGFEVIEKDKSSLTLKPTLKFINKSVNKQQALQLYKQTKSKEFKEWFGDSKVVDENGEPLIVYHGSKENFNAFSKDKIYSGEGQDLLDSGMINGFDELDAYGKRGFFFTLNKGIAKFYAKGTNNIYPSFIRITYDIVNEVRKVILNKKLYDSNRVNDILLNKISTLKNNNSVSRYSGMSYLELKHEIINSNIEKKQEILDYIESKINLFDVNIDIDRFEQVLNARDKEETYFNDYVTDVFQILQNNGIKLINKEGYWEDDGQLIVFEPTQIKSVFNQGTFNKENNNIYLSDEAIFNNEVENLINEYKKHCK